MTVFVATDRDYEDFVLGKKKYLLTKDEGVKGIAGHPLEGYNRVMTPGGAIADLNITDITELHTTIGEVYILTAEIEKIWQ